LFEFFFFLWFFIKIDDEGGMKMKEGDEDDKN